ncbi:MULTISPECIES: hypothetical protein [Chryseobacterium]|nr:MULTISPECIES: hypothetical protein [Chryseobacterium]TXI90202.1 MAG: hypothetical protein E6Q36_01865 [Chryseobacterium sp.]MDH5031944.1 hypothetical protein [Chryseobacterium cucumeris]QWT85612.1 hypothetical protein KBP46_19555 [Chryseobacterium sp. PCH239]RKE82973.1 hypothetical protein DEU39_2536 [Chryseobacterium sp. AG363]WFB69820.1 hypothetical protein PZ898_10355 [Chryseobacterium sp. WX]
MKKILLLLLFFPLMFFSQDLQPGEFVWSKERKLQKEDYKLITHDDRISIRSAINFSYQLRGFNALSNNFNKKIINKFSSSASSINPDSRNIPAMIEYQQVNFDLAEVYARKMRKDLLIHKNTLWKGFTYANEMFNNLTAEYTKAQALIDNETNYGLNTQKLQDWKQKIQNELDELSDFDYNNTSKIKIKKDSKEEN